MIEDVKKGENGRGFYGWYALTGAMVTAFISGGALINAFGVLLPAICDKFQWSRAIVAGFLSVGLIAFGLPSPIYGFLVNRFGPRLCIILGNLLAGLGFASIYFVDEIWQFYTLYIIIGAGSGLGGYIASTTIANNWFIKRRSLAFGFVLSSAGLGGFFFPPMVAALLSLFGIHKSYLVLAFLVLAGSVVLGGLILIRDRPEDVGQLPDIKLPGPCVEQDEHPPQAGDDQALFRLSVFLKKPTVWLIAGFVTANSFASGTVMPHQVAYLRDIGFNAIIAATTMSSLAISNLTGSIVFGTLAMRFDIRYLATAAFLFEFIAMIILMSTRELAFIYIYTVFMGLGNGSLSTALPTFIGNYYPRGYYSLILGFIFPFNLLSQATAAATVGAIYDSTHSYQLAFSILIICSVMGMICSLTARKPDG